MTTTKPKNIRHSSENPRWGSPDAYVSIAKTVLALRRDGRRDAPITIDPFSEIKFNASVGACRILTGEGLDGFKDRWISATPSVVTSIGASERYDHQAYLDALDSCPRADQLLAGFKFNSTLVEATGLVNPPGDDSGENVKNAYRLAHAYYTLGWLAGGVVWVAFNLNQLQTLQMDGVRSPLSGDFVRCVPDHREAFVPVDGLADAPSHPSFFLLMPAHDQVVAAEQVRLFTDLASKLGEVW